MLLTLVGRLVSVMIDICKKNNGGGLCVLFFGGGGGDGRGWREKKEGL